MKDDQRQRIIKRHAHSIWMHGYKPQALYWENSEVQQLRFQVLLECGVQSGDSVLDVGCGFGDLYRYMVEQGIETDYTGIDLSPDMIEAAKAQAPQLCFAQGDLFDFDPAPQSVDWVLLSGALNEPLKDDGAYLHQIIPRLYATCRKGVAFNLLNGDYPWTAQQLYTLQPYPPREVLGQLQALCPNVRQRNDYLEIDVTFYAWRDAASRPPGL